MAKTQRTIGHFNRQSRLSDLMKRRMNKGKSPEELNNAKTGHTTFGTVRDLHEVTSHIYTDAEIKKFNMQLAIDNHPLHKKPTNLRSKLAYKEIMEQVSRSPRYLLPGMFTVFGYRQPKYKEELKYYDGTPAVIFFGITRTKDSAIREIGFNLHYFPPFARAKIINVVYEVFKQYYDKYFNDVPSRPNRMVNYAVLKRLLDKYGIGFGLRMYIPVLRGQTYILPTRMVPTMAYTEGHFSGATLGQIQKYWRRFRR